MKQDSVLVTSDSAATLASGTRGLGYPDVDQSLI